MSHKSLNELRLEIFRASEFIEVSGEYQHYKNEHIYKVLGFVVTEATDEVAVRYVNVDEPSVEFVRPVSSWMEEVDNMPRFIKISRE